MNRSPIRTVSKKRARLLRVRRKRIEAFFGPFAPCEARLVDCEHVAVDPHEIKTRARRGSIIDVSNIAGLCRPCHTFITLNPSWSDRHGWTLPSWATEAEVDDAWSIRRICRCSPACTVDHRDEAGFRTCFDEIHHEGPQAKGSQ